MSNKNYCNVTLEDMRRVLQADKGWSTIVNPYSREYIFSFPLSTSPHIQIRVASGITANGQSRACGKDAIRVFAVDTNKDQGYIKSKSVYRITTWRINLEKAVMNCFEQAKNRRRLSLTNQLS